MGWATYSRLLSDIFGWVTWYAGERTVVVKCTVTFQPLIVLG
jgi:hypothetical protein